MGWFKNLFSKKDDKKVDEEEFDVGEKNKKSKLFKESLVKKAKDLSPEQWQIRFFKERGLNQFVSNPVCAEYLLSIPDIAEIKDEETYNNAMENIIFIDGTSTSNLGKSFLFHHAYYMSSQDKFIISFSQNDSQYSVNVKRYNEDFRTKRENKDEETRVYDKKTGLEVERIVKSETFLYSNWYKITRLSKEGEDIGIAKLEDSLTRIEPSVFKKYIDLTKTENINTLDSVQEKSIFDSTPKCAVIGLCLDYYDSIDKLKADGYKERIEKQRNNSSEQNLSR